MSASVLPEVDCNLLTHMMTQSSHHGPERNTSNRLFEMLFRYSCVLISMVQEIACPRRGGRRQRGSRVNRMAPKIDLVRDYADRCRHKLNEAGYSISSTDSREIIRNYLNIRHRRIRTMPRLFHQVPYTVPAHLAGGHAALKATVENGGDLWPYQSRRITKSAVEDGMLNDFGIQHFHLGTTPDPEHANLMSGTKELLFAVIRDGHFYAIGIYDHSNWSTQALLDVVHQTWLDLFETFSVQNVDQLSVTYSDQEIASMRQVGINSVTRRRDGTIHGSPGGGIGTDGTSLAVTRELIGLIGFLEKYEKLVAEDFETGIKKGATGADKEITLVWRDGRAFAKCGDLEMDLLGNLQVPPL
jgi:hypothetical protein